jgi:glycosyltransferase involved in cell wall biosynthesis
VVPAGEATRVRRSPNVTRLYGCINGTQRCTQHRCRTLGAWRASWLTDRLVTLTRDCVVTVADLGTSRAMISVLQVIPDLGVGGAERMLLNLATALDQSRYRVHVVSFYDQAGTSVEAELGRACVPIACLGKRRGFDANMFGAMRRVVRTLRPDVIHTHRAVLQYALPAICESRAAVVHTVHNVAIQEVPLVGRFAHRLAFAAGVAPVAIGEMVAKSFTEVYRRAPAKIVANGIDTAAFHRPSTTKASWRAKEGIDPAAVVCVAVARFAAQKNLQLLLSAFQRVVAREPRALLCLAGDGPERESLRSRCAALRIADRVRFLGPRADVPELLASSDVFVLSSTWEGNPLSVMEAMAAGIPVVSTAVGGVPEIVRNGVTGRLVATEDSEALGNAIGELVRSRATRIAMGLAGRERADSAFDKRTMASGYAALYEELMRARTAA